MCLGVFFVLQTVASRLLVSDPSSRFRFQIELLRDQMTIPNWVEDAVNEKERI